SLVSLAFRRSPRRLACGLLHCSEKSPQASRLGLREPTSEPLVATVGPLAHRIAGMDTIDLNCDLGEGCPHDGELMPLITSANIACGFHAGDARTSLAAVRLAVRHGA